MSPANGHRRPIIGRQVPIAPYKPAGQTQKPPVFRAKLKVAPKNDYLASAHKIYQQRRQEQMEFNGFMARMRKVHQTTGSMDTVIPMVLRQKNIILKKLAESETQKMKSLEEEQKNFKKSDQELSKSSFSDCYVCFEDATEKELFECVKCKAWMCLGCMQKLERDKNNHYCPTCRCDLRVLKMSNNIWLEAYLRFYSNL